jgi:hypothetical protein
VAVAVNCCVVPTATVAVAGNTEIEVTVPVAAVTVSDSVPLIPLRDAVTMVEPTATPVARPLEFTVANACVATDQVAVELMLAVEPSL